MLTRPSLRLALVVAAAAASCADPAPGGPPIIGKVARLEIPMTLNRNLDLLFVIDNSPAMAPHRAKLLDNYRRFMVALETAPHGLADIHIGVVTTDLGTRGAQDAAAGPAIGTGPGSCISDGDRGNLRRVSSIDGAFLSDINRADGTRERNYTGSLADAFAQLADVGAAGCTYPRPVEAMKRSLGANPSNAGFLREDAFLAVVVLTSGDDCSFARSTFTGGQLDASRCATDPNGLVLLDDYIAFLKELKGDPSKVVVLGAFVPPGGPACADTRPAPRLGAFFDAFPNRSTSVSICEQDLSPALAPVTHVLRTTLGFPCFEADLLDLDPIADGLQPECNAWYRYDLDGETTEELIPACRADSTNSCYKLGPDPLNCMRGTRVEFLNRRFGSGSEALAIIECVTQ